MCDNRRLGYSMDNKALSGAPTLKSPLLKNLTNATGPVALPCPMSWTLRQTEMTSTLFISVLDGMKVLI
jgi:hypothetical protein